MNNNNNNNNNSNKQQQRQQQTVTTIKTTTTTTTTAAITTTTTSDVHQTCRKCLSYQHVTCIQVRLHLNMFQARSSHGANFFSITNMFKVKCIPHEKIIFTELSSHRNWHCLFHNLKAGNSVSVKCKILVNTSCQKDSIFLKMHNRSRWTFQIFKMYKIHNLLQCFSSR